jgi:polynucleotide 5'-hydroxyl-kinase GRC3/NOL9
MKVPKGEYLVFKGPCNIRAIQGEIKILGLEGEEFSITSDDTFSVSSDKGADIITNCEFITSFPSLGWEGVIEAIASTGGIAIVLGKEDSGKTYLSKSIYNASRKGKFVDMDVGQSTVFLPGFLSTFSGSSLWLNNPLRFAESQFFGDITPSINPKLHLELALKLVKKREDLTVVDTDGWLNGYGRKHKEELINLLDPDFIISMGRGVHVPPGYEERTIRLRTTPRSLFKSREKRAERRRKLFAYYFQNAEKYSVLLEGRRLGMRGSSCLPMDWLDGLLVGLENNGRIVGAGLLSVSSQSILTPCRTFDNYIMGFIALGIDMRERRLNPTLAK